MEFIDRRPGPLPPGRPAAATSVHTRHNPTPRSAEGQSGGSRITRTSCCAGVPAAVAHRFRSAAEARGFTQYLTAPVSLREAIRKRADDADIERFLPECTFRGRENTKLQYAVLAAAALHGGTEPDLLDEVAWWQTDDFWQYALFAAVAYIRAAASRAGVPVRQACQDLGERPGHPTP
jgi:hypothetical protein